MSAEFTVDELLEKIVSCLKIEAGLKDVEAGRTFKHEEILDLIVRK